MVVTGQSAYSGIPVADGQFVAAPASGTAHDINPGDWVIWSGQYIIAANTGNADWKASGLGVALDNNPAYDWAGRTIINSAVMVARYGIFRVSANFSGQPNLGTIVAPVTTGSGVNGPSGATGVGAAWNTATPAIAYMQQITYDYRDLASAISAYVAGTATGSALLPGSGLLSANGTSASIRGVGQVIGWFNSGPGGTGQLDVVIWDRNADYY